VLVDRFDCRSRRAARGVVRSRAKSSRKRRSLAPPHRSEGRKSVGSRPGVAKPEVRWRVRVEAVAKAIALRATRRGKALRAVKPTSFDEEVAESVLAATRGFGPAASRHGASEARSSSSRAAENAAAKGRRLRDPSIRDATRSSRRSRPRQKTMVVWSSTPKLAALRQQAQSLESSGGASLQRT
jgi:hypothetical protein